MPVIGFLSSGRRSYVGRIEIGTFKCLVDGGVGNFDSPSSGRRCSC